MLIKILISVAVLVVLFLIVVAMRPSEFTIIRSGAIDAPPGVVFAHVNDFHNWDAWSPWAKLDPGMKQTYEGPAAGTGASYSWEGNGKVGQGRMTISESRPNELIRIHLEFIKPFPGVCPTTFTFEPHGNQTRVTWTMTGKHTFVPKAIGTLVNMNKMIGQQFEKGLAQMKAAAESADKLSAAT